MKGVGADMIVEVQNIQLSISMIDVCIYLPAPSSTQALLISESKLMFSLALPRRQIFSRSTLLCRAIHGSNVPPTPPNLTALETREDTEKARSWIAKFKEITIPRSHVELSFARSSGPGGQVSALNPLFEPRQSIITRSARFTERQQSQYKSHYQMPTQLFLGTRLVSLRTSEICKLVFFSPNRIHN
jgi:hypothetical protein